MISKKNSLKRAEKNWEAHKTLAIELSELLFTLTTQTTVRGYSLKVHILKWFNLSNMVQIDKRNCDRCLEYLMNYFNNNIQDSYFLFLKFLFLICYGVAPGSYFINARALCVGTQ
eukprot:TRINITY_DN46167_c0_g1_i1.p1 TRINITY_DN46167_c0_g1~~TRINITY_DN46167_c0_g1_i1.p1  ORF type:complete len:115 (+),score=5.74 TRINITY_DN46167_c0_g1_i1:242-586(+)